LAISQNTAYRLIARDEFPLPLVRVGRRWYVRSVDLDALVGVDGTSP
jgi:predicted DNA-binding transcriptional regulator AlpA